MLNIPKWSDTFQNSCNIHCTHKKKKTKFFIQDFFSKCDQIHRKLRVWSHLLKKSLMEKFIFCAVSGQPLSLDINISTKYVYVKKTYTQQEWKSHGNHVFRMSWKLRCASVAWNMSLYHRDKDFRLCKCRTLKSSCTNVVKARLCECSVQPYRRQRFQVVQV